MPAPAAASTAEFQAAPAEQAAPQKSDTLVAAPPAAPVVVAEATPSVDVSKSEPAQADNNIVSAVEAQPIHHKEQPAVGSPFKETVVQSAPVSKSHAHHGATHHNVHNPHHHHAVHHSKVTKN